MTRAATPHRHPAQLIGERTRMVISKRWTGLGDCLVSLLAAWRFAHATGRALVADWRRSCYVNDPRTNVFGLVFEPAPVVAGVPFLGDDTINDLVLAGPFHPATWHAATVSKHWTRHGLEDRAEREAAVALVASGADVEAPVVVFDGCLNDAVPSHEACRRVLGALRPRARIAEAVAAFEERYLVGRPIVAVHVRHGNGGNIGAHARYWASPPAALGRVIGATLWAVRAMRSEAGVDPVVFVCTDSRPVEALLQQALPGVVTRPKTFRPPGAGELHLWDRRLTSLMDATVEMLLLARSDVLVRFPPGSFFSFWGVVMKRPPRVPPDAHGQRVTPGPWPTVC